MWESILNFLESTGIVRLFTSPEDPWMWLKTLVMYAIVCGLVYLAVVKQYEPLLLLPIAFGMLLANLPGANLIHTDLFLSEGPLDIVKVVQGGSLLDFLYLGVKLGIFPALIFMGVGAMTDFTALIANPKSLLIGAAAQIGVFLAFSGAVLSGFFSPQEAAAIGIIAGADGPTAIQVTKELAPPLLGSIAIAAYSYMALIPMIQPPIMRALTTKKERLIKMTALRRVSKTERLIFPILVTIVVALIVPDAVMLVGFLMFGNILNVCGVTDRLSKTAQNGLMNAITIFLGVTVGATASAENFLRIETFLIIILGFLAFAIATAAGLLFAKLMCLVTGGKINPLIGAAGVSAVPMAARMAQKVGAEADPTNFLLMHAMGPNVAGIIGSAVAAGVFLSWNW